MRSSLFVAALALAGCQRCGDKAVPDAGLAAPQVVRKNTDLRTALVQLYPEYRNTGLLETEASLTRVIPGLTEAQRDASLQKLGWQRSPDGGPGWVLNRFVLEQPAPDTLVLKLPLTVEDVGHLFQSPTAISSMEMAIYLPRDLPVGRESFELNLHYTAKPERAREVVKQSVSLLLANRQWKFVKAPPEWSADAAADEALPETFTVEIESHDGARISYERDGKDVWAHFRLATVLP